MMVMRNFGWEAEPQNEWKKFSKYLECSCCARLVWCCINGLLNVFHVARASLQMLIICGDHFRRGWCCFALQWCPSFCLLFRFRQQHTFVTESSISSLMIPFLSKLDRWPLEMQHLIFKGVLLHKYIINKYIHRTLHYYIQYTYTDDFHTHSNPTLHPQLLKRPK